MTCRFSVEDARAKVIAVVERAKRIIVSSAMPLLLASSRERHSLASQREIEAFWKQNPVRTTTIETREANFKELSSSSKSKGQAIQ